MGTKSGIQKWDDFQKLMNKAMDIGRVDGVLEDAGRKTAGPLNYRGLFKSLGEPKVDNVQMHDLYTAYMIAFRNGDLD